MIDKILDYVLVKAAGTAIWTGVAAVASLPFYHLLTFGVVLLLCIWLTREVITLARLWRD